MSDLRHKVKMQQMQIEEAEGLKFDIELLTDEKSMLEDDLNKLSMSNRELESKVQELQKSA